MTSRKRKAVAPAQHAAAAHMFSAEGVAGLQDALLGWFAASARDLPWRRLQGENRPYGVWVSEVMLQQTRVETVIPYYNKWMDKFPDVQALAAAELQDVYDAWAGLGYYSRARRLHEAAQFVQKKMQGKLPGTAAELQKLPGVGPYTAGAVSSIAFNQPEPLVDGNVARVFSRLRAVRAPANDPKAMKLFWEIAKQVVHKEKPGDLNQSLMELGATICLPTNPHCSKCPVAEFCLAKQLINKDKNVLDELSSDAEPCDVCVEAADVEDICNYPMKKAKKAPKGQLSLMRIIENSQGEFLLWKIKSGKVLADQWLFPSVEQDVNEDDDTKSVLKEMKANFVTEVFGDDEDVADFFKELKFKEMEGFTHVFSHIRRQVMLEHAKSKTPLTNLGTGANFCWKTKEELNNMSFTSSMSKAIKQLNSKPKPKQAKMESFFSK